MNTSRPLRIASWVAVAAWALAIIVLSSLSGPRIEEINVLRLWDKAAHFLAFGAGAVLLAVALKCSTRWMPRRIALTAIVAISVFAATDEWHQLYTPNRSGADLGDWLADVFGAIACAAAVTFIHARHQRKNRPAPAGA